MKKPVISISVVLAFIVPYLSVGSGLITSWLFVHFHWLGIFNIHQNTVAKVIASSVVFGITAVLTYAAAHFHWLPVVINKLERRSNPLP